MTRWRLDIAYDGANFSGWATQPDRRTVQGELETWIRRVLLRDQPTPLTVAGRTDAGVHARGQVAHVDLPDNAIAEIRQVSLLGEKYVALEPPTDGASSDRLGDGEIQMTQERIASMLGVRRESVTDAALKLQSAGLIRYSRGHIRVFDRAGLEKRTCTCYAVVKSEYDRLLPDRLAA